MGKFRKCLEMGIIIGKEKSSKKRDKYINELVGMLESIHHDDFENRFDCEYDHSEMLRLIDKYNNIGYFGE